MNDRSLAAEAFAAGLATPAQLREVMGPHGAIAYVLRGPCELSCPAWRSLGACSHQPIQQSGYGDNLITDAGDLYIAGMVIAGVQPANATAPTRAIGMKMGTGTTAPAKNGAGGALVTYSTGTHRAFDSGKPDTVNLGAGLGVQARYVTTYPAGVATVTGLAEAIIAMEATLTDATNTAATTACRGLLSPVVNKGASDTLTITWTWKYLGA